jgi:hypothetical protein
MTAPRVAARRMRDRTERDRMADYETFCSCGYEKGDRVCLCMRRLPLLVVQRPCDSCKRGRHRMTKRSDVPGLDPAPKKAVRRG